jgi:hypothetical protein
MTPQQQTALEGLVGRALTEAEVEQITPLVAQQGTTQAIADILSAGRTRVVSHFASERGVLERFPGGALAADALMTKLEGFAATAHPMASIVKRALKFLAQAEGLDIGSPATLGLIDALQAGGVITAEERNGLRAMATQAAPINEFDVRRALYEGA